MSGAGDDVIREALYQACHDTQERLAVDGKVPLYEDYADAALDALRSLPVEQRMEAMGMRYLPTLQAWIEVKP